MPQPVMPACRASHLMLGSAKVCNSFMINIEEYNWFVLDVGPCMSLVVFVQFYRDLDDTSLSFVLLNDMMTVLFVVFSDMILLQLVLVLLHFGD